MRIEEQLDEEVSKRQAYNQIEQLLDLMNDGVLIINEEGRIVHFNEQAAKLLDTNQRETAGKLFWEAFPNDFFGFPLKEALSKQPESLHTHMQLQQTALDVKGIFTELEDNGKSQLILIIKEAASTPKVTNESLSMDRLIHDIRNPLSGIRGFASLLQGDLQGDERKQSMAAHIVSGVDKLNKLLTAVLAYSKPVQEHLEEGDLIETIEEALQENTHSAQFNPNITVVKNWKDKPIPFKMDAKLIKRALVEVIKNALEAMPDGGTLTVSVENKNRELTISIKDTGSGIEEERLSKLFQPLFTTKPDVYGFGLTEARKIAKAHQGSLNAISQVGKGSTFTFQFPI